ncbi:MAG: hypothetical protein Q9220_000115 [cf. Caloplaca sp. 1 TL-2023]
MKTDSGDDDDTVREEQEATYAEFTRVVCNTLLKGIDRRGNEHAFTFSAEDDAWGICWRERTGIPLATFRDRWDQLEDHPADLHFHPGDPHNRDPYVTKERAHGYNALKAADKGKTLYTASSTSGSVGSCQITSVLGKRKTSALCGGSIQALVYQISYLGAQYLQSYKGFETTGDDGWLWNLINMVRQGEVKDLDLLLECQHSLEYRMNQMAAADTYVRDMGIPKPKDLSCYEYDIRGIVEEVGEEKYRTILAAIYRRPVLFPKPVEDQGRPFNKGKRYLIAAIHFANLDTSLIESKLDTLAQSLQQEVEFYRALIKDVPEAKVKRQRLFRLFGFHLENISPRKRQSPERSLGDS